MANWDWLWDTMLGRVATVTTIVLGIIYLWKKRHDVFITLGKAIDKCKKLKSEIPHFKVIASVITLLVILLVIFLFIHHDESSEFDVTLDEIPQRFQNDSTFIISKGKKMQDLIGIVDMYWAWGISKFNRPEHSLHLNPRDGSNNLIYLISMEDKEELKDTLEEIGIWDKYEKYDLEKKDISTFAYFSNLNGKNYLWIIEKESGGLNVAALYLSNPASWFYHNEDSFLFFSWQDSNEDGFIQIHEIIVEPQKNPMTEFWPEPRKEENPLMQEFGKSSVISLGTSSDNSDLVSAANITWSLGYFLSYPEKPEITVEKIGEMEAGNVIIVGGTFVNENAKETCDRFGIKAICEEGRNWKITVKPGTLEILAKNLNVEDVCIIAFEKMNEGNRILMAGIGGSGTLAGSIFLSEKENWEHLERHNVLILKWQDENGDRAVQLDEIILKYRLDIKTSQNMMKWNKSAIGRI